MAHRSKNNSHRHPPVIDDDDYVYPSKKIRETKTRGRRHDKNLIKDGLIAYANPDEDSFDDEEEDLLADQMIMDDYNEMITEFNRVDEDEDDIEDWDHHHSHDDINDEYDHLYDGHFDPMEE